MSLDVSCLLEKGANQRETDLSVLLKVKWQFINKTFNGCLRESGLSYNPDGTLSVSVKILGN